jgi:hypothetical protein
MTWFVVILLHTSASTAFAQPTPSTKGEPAIRRWLDVQSVHVGARWFKNSDDQLVSGNLQWQTQLRGRFLVDRALTTTR